jgi:predicted CXXCH cytochrome family protein
MANIKSYGICYSGEPDSYLAGGNFWWVKEGLGGDDTKGHNVFLGEDDDNLARGPGGFSVAWACTNSCHDNLSQPYTGGNIYGNIDGKYGCEGCHRPRHHANDHPNGQSGLADSVESGWYRFLSETHAENRYGVKGYEDGLWEAGQPDIAPGTTEHNEYLGYTGGENGISGPGSIKGLCQGCHINFGPGGGALPTNQQDAHGSWIRHPSDMQIPDSGEYANAGGASHLYDPLTPVARPNVNNSSSGTINVGIDMVTCLSCHRPHGSPYPDMLRWDYIQQIAGGGDNGKGCFFCHTTKDDS